MGGSPRNDSSGSGKLQEGGLRSSWVKGVLLSSLTAHLERVLDFRRVKSWFLGEGCPCSHRELREEAWAAVRDQGLGPVKGRAVPGAREARECRGQVSWTVRPRTARPSLGSCSWIGEWGTLRRKRESWRSAVFDGGGRAADPPCLGPACEDCVFDL